MLAGETDGLTGGMEPATPKRIPIPVLRIQRTQPFGIQINFFIGGKSLYSGRQHSP